MNSALPSSILPTEAPFSSRDFRDALGQFATGVTIITARSPEGHPVGVTVSSFNSVSLTPPLVLWSMTLSAASLPVFQHCRHYAIHVLASDQKPLAELFARKGVDRFANTAWRSSAQGVPLLDNTAAVFECRNRSRYEEGDHIIFVGAVEQCRHLHGRAPLLYHGGRMYADGRITPP
ncbi:flavin reductase family protein [Comamonas composti]|uniref:flavin reductase family protein n=1 Tax=Comamonas composti TaxID=408558 RepID=UPI00041BE251|nr:flavin reductase family protein [Comamonas composti]